MGSLSSPLQLLNILKLNTISIEISTNIQIFQEHLPQHVPAGDINDEADLVNTDAAKN